MATPAQIEANRKNSQRSTGPKTPEGKARASQNARTHGLLAKDVVLRDEDPRLFDEQRDALRTHFDPVGAYEELLVERMAIAAWKMRRSPQIEASLFRYEVFDTDMHEARGRMRTFEVSSFDAPSPMVGAAGKSAHAAAEADRDRAKAARDRETLAIAFTKAEKHNGLSKLSRYDVAHERSFYRALHELERVQARRNGRQVPPPAVVDIDVAGTPPPNQPS